VNRTSESLTTAFGAVLLELGERHPLLRCIDVEPSPAPAVRAFAERFPSRATRPAIAGTEGLSRVVEGVDPSHPTVLTASTSWLVSGGYAELRATVAYPRLNLTIVTHDAGLLGGGSGGSRMILEDLGILRGLPGMSVVVPADGPTTRTALTHLAVRTGPSYLRLTTGSRATVTDGGFELGRAGLLRPGDDLTVVALGAMVAPALDLAEDLARVGVSVRVLDFASVKPFDEPALLRAARDTGAILVLEEHSVLTGVGALVAATTSENYPVPVRRVGMADLFAEPSEDATAFERYGLGPARIRDEAWELLRLRGKVQ
jgi:transketolase